jgi:hypothetical protein
MEKNLFISPTYEYERNQCNGTMTMSSSAAEEEMMDTAVSAMQAPQYFDPTSCMALHGSLPHRQTHCDLPS